MKNIKTLSRICKDNGQCNTQQQSGKAVILRAHFPGYTETSHHSENIQKYSQYVLCAKALEYFKSCIHFKIKYEQLVPKKT